MQSDKTTEIALNHDKIAILFFDTSCINLVYKLYKSCSQRCIHFVPNAVLRLYTKFIRHLLTVVLVAILYKIATELSTLIRRICANSR